MLKVENLVYEYPNKRVLHGLNFVIEKGSITVLIGPNGAGKTTLIRCMVGLSTPFAGKVFFNNKDVHLDPIFAHKSMGYLPDFFGIYDSLTVKQCLVYAALSQGVSESSLDETVKIAAERLFLTSYMNDLAGDLSRGLKQRLAIAQAIIHKPEFLVLDEPASGLDPDARVELSKLFKQLRAEGVTLVVSSHILAELDDYATDMLVIKDGRIANKKDIANKDAIISRRLLMKLSSPNEKVKNFLENIDGISAIADENDFISFGFTGGATEQSALLKKLINENFPIVEFKEGNARLHDAYIASVNN